MGLYEMKTMVASITSIRRFMLVVVSLTLVVLTLWITLPASVYMPGTRSLDCAACTGSGDLYESVASHVTSNLTSNLMTMCNRTLKAADHDLPLTALASPWGSGNTWFRHVLQEVTGIATTSIYCDKRLIDSFPFECLANKCRAIVVKTHKPVFRSMDKMPSLKYVRAVVLIRNPYNFIVSNMHDTLFTRATEHDYLTNKEWKKRQPEMLDWWNKFYDVWLGDEVVQHAYPVLYSRLLTDLDGELHRVLDFLRWNYTDSDISCAVTNQEGNYHRQARTWTRINSIVELFSTEMQLQINSSIARMSERLKRKYDIMWID